jgi:hypothetical protein
MLADTDVYHPANDEIATPSQARQCYDFVTAQVAVALAHSAFEAEE